MFSAKRMRSAVAAGATPDTALNLFEHAIVLSQRANTAPISGGSLVVNGQQLGAYDYTVKSATTLASFVDSDWFTATKDTASAWVIVNGDLTINSGVTLRPAARKLLTVVCVTGNLTLNGSISMSQRGANHSGTGDSGGLTPPVPVRVYSGAISTYTNPNIGATGGTGGAGVTAGATYLNGTVGGLAASIGTGGGGSGSAYTATSGAGASGTCFSGGAGGGAGYGANAFAGVDNGGAGGISTNSAWSGVGNGTGSLLGANTGTGGVLVVIVLGSVSGSGSITAAGGSFAFTWTAPYSPAVGMGGGASGGGVALLIQRSGTTPAISAPGGTSVITNGFANGGSGGDGFAGAWTLPTTSAWTGGNQIWSSPDSDSFNNVFINGNAASITSSVNQTITIVGTVAPSSTAFAVSAGVLSIAGVLGGGPISKSGTGQLNLNGAANTFVGDVTLSGGTLQIAGDGSLGNASNLLLFAASATLRLNTDSTLSRNVSIASGAIATFGNGSVIISGVLSGSGTFRFSALFANCRLTNANNTFSGPISVLSGYVEAVSLPDSAGAISLGNSGLATQFTWAGAAKTFNDRPFALVGTTGGGVISNSNSNPADTLTINKNLSVSTAGNKSLGFAGPNAGTNAFNGVIADGTSAVISVSKSGSGLWQLGGNNTYSGGTTISGGTLSAGSANAFGTGAVTVSTGATLRLNGYTIPNTIVNNGGTVIP